MKYEINTNELLNQVSGYIIWQWGAVFSRGCAMWQPFLLNSAHTFLGMNYLALHQDTEKLSVISSIASAFCIS